MFTNIKEKMNEYKKIKKKKNYLQNNRNNFNRKEIKKLIEQEDEIRNEIIDEIVNIAWWFMIILGMILIILWLSIILVHLLLANI